ncbi:formate dehydrogenase accessory protein FdhE [Chloroflexota bacterium]
MGLTWCRRCRRRRRAVVAHAPQGKASRGKTKKRKILASGSQDLLNQYVAILEGDLTNEVDIKTLGRLEEWDQKEGQVPGFVQLYRELLQIQSEAKSSIIVTKPNLVDGLVYDQLCKGIPLLSFKDFSLDWHQVQMVFERVANWATKDLADPSGESESLRNISQNRSLLRNITRAWYQGHSLKGIAAAEGIDEELLNSVVAAALKPFLFLYSRLLLPKVDQELWRRKHCPICGSKPDFAYLDKEKGARWLVCTRCDTEWLFVRLECPYCGTQNQEALAYFIDDEGLYRLYVCEQCHTYIKAIDLRRVESEILWPLERLTTLDMDKQGQEKGYKPGWATL